MYSTLVVAPPAQLVAPLATQLTMLNTVQSIDRPPPDVRFPLASYVYAGLLTPLTLPETEETACGRTDDEPDEG